MGTHNIIAFYREINMTVQNKPGRTDAATTDNRFMT